MDKKPKDFQQATAEHIVDIFKSGKQLRVLLSDEVGLGKTIVAKEVIRLVGELDKIWEDDIYRVIYVCSNVNIVKQNTANLGIEDVMNIDESRLSMQHLILEEETRKLNLKTKKPRVLIPLTPGTSFNISGFTGNMNERALMYVFLTKLPDFCQQENALFKLLNRYNAKIENWRSKIEDYRRRVVACGEEYINAITDAIVKDDAYQTTKNLFYSAILDGKGIDNAISKMRQIFCRISMNQLAPDLVIMDEFQKFSGLLNVDEYNEESMIARNFFDSANMPFILLLSATPYKPYTTLEELNADKVNEQYEDFLKLMNFLFKGRQDISFKTVWRDYTRELCQASSENFEVLYARKVDAEDAMYKTMSRTERYQVATVQDIVPLEITSDDIRAFCQMQNIIEDCNKATNHGFNVSCIPMDYVKSSPYLLSFMDKYKLKRKIVSVYENGRTLPLPGRRQRILLNENEIYHYRNLPPSNARLQKLMDILFKKGGERLFWIPSSHFYYEVPADNVFEKNRDFSKILVFSAWEMVPRMVSVMVSYKAEQLNIVKAFPLATYTNNKETEQQNQINREQRKRGGGVSRLRESSLELVCMSSDFLAGCYVPKETLGWKVGDVRELVKGKIAERLKLDSVRNRNVEGLVQLVGSLDDESSIGVSVSEEDLKTLANMAIASPGICAYRILKDRYKARNVAAKIAAIFNRRMNAAAMDLIYGSNNVNAYFELVFDYCVMGNLQSVLDEYAQMISEEHDVDRIYERMLSSFTDMGSIDVETKSSFANKAIKRYRMRTLYAMPFSKVKTDEKNAMHANNIREAFNSPFRPFVLTSTSIGQEGLDFHWYCRKVMHWNIPSNPQDIEQREGRVNRYKSLSIRRNVAKLFPEEFTWDGMFNRARQWAYEHHVPELVPYWSLPNELLTTLQGKEEPVERIVPLYPLSSDIERYERMKEVLGLYRLTMGQPNQEALITLLKGLNEEQREKLLFNLSPIKREKKSFKCYCKYYKGEKNNPYEPGSLEGKFWHGEMMFCTTVHDPEKWVKDAKEIRSRLSQDKLAFANQFSDEQFAMIIFTEQLFLKWCPYDDTEWIFQY